MNRQLLRVSFVMDLANHESVDRLGHLGPLFTEWLPDGEETGIQLTPQLRVWFERRLVERDGILAWQRSGERSERVALQGKLSAGPLFGVLHVPMPSDGVLATIRDEGHRRDRERDLPVDPEAERFAKSIARAIAGPIEGFVGALRNEYGQYWLQEQLAWDSRTQSLGSFFSQLEIRVHLPEGDVRWTPTILSYRLTVRGFGTSFDDLLTEMDWDDLKERDWTKEAPAAAAYLGRAAEQLAKGELKFALLEAANALELSIAERLHSKDAEISKLLVKIENSATLTSRAVVLLTSIDAPTDEIRATIECVEARNDAFHKPSRRQLDRGTFRLFLRAVARLAGISTLKHPILSSDNRTRRESVA